MIARAKQTAVKAPVIAPAANATEADELIGRIGVLQRNRMVAELRMNNEFASAKEIYQYDAAIIDNEIKDCRLRIQAWCEVNRAVLTGDGETKTHKFGNGEVSWRKRPPKVSIRGGVEKVIAAIKANLAFKNFLRVKEEIDKEAMLKEPALATTIPGVSIGSAGEDFVIKPFATELEEVS